MKVRHKDGANDKTTADLLSEARVLEDEDKVEEASRIYEGIIKEHPVNEAAYD